jgi:probable phosphoglycerate mutase
VKVLLHTDAGLRSKVQKAGVGFVIRADEPSMRGEIIREGAMILDEFATISEAEYSALIWGLYNCHALGATHVDVFMDSQLVVRQVLGKYACRALNLQDYLAEVKDLIRGFDEVRMNWVGRDKNTYADGIVRKLLEEEVAA